MSEISDKGERVENAVSNELVQILEVSRDKQLAPRTRTAFRYLVDRLCSAEQALVVAANSADRDKAKETAAEHFRQYPI